MLTSFFDATVPKTVFFAVSAGGWRGLAHDVRILRDPGCTGGPGGASVPPLHWQDDNGAVGGGTLLQLTGEIGEVTYRSCRHPFCVMAWREETTARTGASLERVFGSGGRQGRIAIVSSRMFGRRSAFPPEVQWASCAAIKVAAHAAGGEGSRRGDGGERQRGGGGALEEVPLPPMSRQDEVAAVGAIGAVVLCCPGECSCVVEQKSIGGSRARSAPSAVRKLLLLVNGSIANQQEGQGQGQGGEEGMPSPPQSTRSGKGFGKKFPIIGKQQQKQQQQTSPPPQQQQQQQAIVS